MPNTFADKVIFITGSAGNIGQAVVRRFANEGARLALAEHNLERLNTFTASLGLNADKHLNLVGDVTDITSVQGMIQQCVSHFGTLDIAVHTVGGYAAGQPVHEAGIEVWDKMMALNAKSTYVVCGQVAKYLVEREQGGKIITILARNAGQGTANAGAYSASKAAAQRIVESMSAELRTYGINVNGIMPANIDTPQNREAMPDANFDTWVTPDDIASTVRFLASHEANAINGASVPIFGCT